MTSWVERDAAAVWHGFTQMSCYADNAPVIVDHGDGHYLVDVNGRRYLDAISSLWVNTLGHRVAELDNALRAQLDRVAHTTMLGNGNAITVEFAEALRAVVPVDGAHVLFASDGACALEQAVRIAFQYWANRGVTGRTTYLAFGDAYHGDTTGGLSLGGGFDATVFDPLRFPVLRAPSFTDPSCFDTACALVAEHAASLAAVVIEPLVQGAAGMLMCSEEQLRRLAAACHEHDVLLVCDEVAVGFGRTGTLFASEQAGVRPDALCLGKGITGGYLPMAATVVSDQVYEAFLGPDLSERTLYYGHSYGGNALAAAVAKRHLELFEEWDVLAQVRESAGVLRRLADEHLVGRPAVRDVRLRGLMGAVELATPVPGTLLARRTAAHATEHGVLLRSIGDTIPLVPPLTVTHEELATIVLTLRAAIDEVCGR